MRYVVSDLHGEYDLFLKLLEKLKFTSGDTMYACGDVVDKGTQSIRLAKQLAGMPNVKCIAGNHEYDFLKHYWALMQNSPADFDGLLKQLQRYFPDDGHLLDWETVDWFESLPYYLEEEDFVCVHAGAPLDDKGRVLPLAEATPEQLVYDRRFKEADRIVADSKCVFFGHTPTSALTHGKNRILSYLREGREGTHIRDYYKIHLDTGTYLSGVLGCFCIDTCTPTYVER